MDNYLLNLPKFSRRPAPAPFRAEDLLLSLPTGLILLAAGIHLFFPQSGLNALLSSLPFLAQILAFPIPLGLLVSLISILIIVILATRGGAHRRRGILAFGILLAAGFLLLLSASSLTLPKQKPGLSPPAPEEERTLRILEWNVLSELSAADVERIFLKLDTDIAVFPEYDYTDNSGRLRPELAAAFAEAGLQSTDYSFFRSSDSRRELETITVVIKKDLGTYQQAPLPDAVDPVSLGCLYLKPVPEPGDKGTELFSAARPEILAVHTSPPLPGLMSVWRKDLTRIEQLSVKLPRAVILGDFNATLRHGALAQVRHHADALSVCRLGDRGSWPSSSPALFRSSIDHILLPYDRYIICSSSILTGGSSDHLPLYTVVKAIN